MSGILDISKCIDEKWEELWDAEPLNPCKYRCPFTFNGLCPIEALKSKS